MEVNDIMQILEKDMKVAVFATVDENGKPHARHAHIGVANEQGVFFMTSPTTDFYKQLKHNPNIAITTMSEEGYLVQVIRIEEKCAKLGKTAFRNYLRTILMLSKCIQMTTFAKACRFFIYMKAKASITACLKGTSTLSKSNFGNQSPNL